MVNGSWVEQSQLDDDTYGTFYDVNSLCDAIKWAGYTISWTKVLQELGTGVYRFRLQVVLFSLPAQCFASPQFCLSEFDCYKVDRTTKFESTISGGKIGDVDKTNSGGGTWQFCCPVINPSQPGIIQGYNPITWNDSIRVEGFFGYEDTDAERKMIKYQTGVVNKIRDEMILKFKWKAGSLPFWFHERFKAYGLYLADQTLVSDYNINNADLNLKRYSVYCDGSYNPDYKNYSRYERVTCEFKAQTQNLLRNRCC